MSTLPKSKLQQIREAFTACDEMLALRIASKFQNLGKQRDRILRGWGAHTQPRNYASLGYDPATLIKDGIKAVKERYGL